MVKRILCRTNIPDGRLSRPSGRSAPTDYASVVFLNMDSAVARTRYA